MTINAPKAGTIVEILAKEDETVTVGQDLYKLAPGGSSSGGSSGSKAKPESTSEENVASGQGSQGRKPAPAPEVANKESQPSRPEPKVTESKQPKSQPETQKKEEPAKPEKKAAAGSRGETRVSIILAY